MDPLIIPLWIIALDEASRRSSPSTLSQADQDASLLITLAICLVAGLAALGWCILSDYRAAKIRGAR